MSVAETAGVLGVSPTEVRRLVHEGTLKAIRVGSVLIVDDSSVAARARRPITRGRLLSSANAWGALWEASGLRAEWLSASDRSRLRSWLRVHEPDYIAHACRNRAERLELRVLPAYRSAVLDTSGVAPGGLTGAARVGADIVSIGDAPDETYCSQATLDGLRRDLGLSEGGEVNLTVRVPRTRSNKGDSAKAATAVEELIEAGELPVAVVAADLLDSDEVRTRRAGTLLLTDAIARLHR